MRPKFALLLFAVTIALTGRLFAGGPPTVDNPSGERVLGRTVIEPAYDDRTGKLIYLLTPEGAPFPSLANQHAVSPLYLPVYPTSAAASVGAMNCQHLPVENCPDHGDGIAAAAAQIMPKVYADSDGHPTVWGHDHLVDGPGGPDFNVAWNVIVVLFTNPAAANHHLKTDEEVDAAVEAGDAIKVPAGTVFNCSVVPAATYARATPWTE